MQVEYEKQGEVLHASGRMQTSGVPDHTSPATQVRTESPVGVDAMQANVQELPMEPLPHDTITPFSGAERGGHVDRTLGRSNIRRGSSNMRKMAESFSNMA